MNGFLIETWGHLECKSCLFFFFFFEIFIDDKQVLKQNWDKKKEIN